MANFRYADQADTEIVTYCVLEMAAVQDRLRPSFQAESERIAAWRKARWAEKLAEWRVEWMRNGGRP